MKVVIVNKSDSTGGAATVSFRLMNALRRNGVDAKMIVTEKLSDSPFVEKAAPEWLIKEKFLFERLNIFVKNGFDRSTLFKIDTGSEGLPLWKNRIIREADVIMLNWVNQGMLSLKGLKKLIDTGKPVIWTMHDLWCMTGICHHPYSCDHFKRNCGDCPLLGKKKNLQDLSFKIHEKKENIYGKAVPKNLKFVAVSNWLAGKAAESSLLGEKDVSVIPNAIPILFEKDKEKEENKEKITILFGAARLDDPIKGFPEFLKMTRILQEKYPALVKNVEIVTFGNIKKSSIIDNIQLSHRHLGMIRGEENIRKIYLQGDILVSASSFETLPTTLVEAQCYGCIPVSFDRGGQSDIIEHLFTGYLARRDEYTGKSAERLADGVAWAITKIREGKINEIKQEMRLSAEKRFSPDVVAGTYIKLFEEMKGW